MYSSLIGTAQLRNWIRNLALTQNFQMSSHAMSKCVGVYAHKLFTKLSPKNQVYITRFLF